MRTRNAISIILFGISAIFMVMLIIYHVTLVVPLTIDSRNYFVEKTKDPGDITQEALAGLEKLKTDIDNLHLSLQAFEQILIYKSGSNQNAGQHLDLISSE